MVLVLLQSCDSPFVGTVPTKRRKGRPTVDDEDSASIADSMGAWASRSQDSIKPPNIYNRTVAEAPAEV